jgi:soluble lytic murein transglycosylase-like protein
MRNRIFTLFFGLLVLTSPVFARSTRTRTTEVQRVAVVVPPLAANSFPRPVPQYLATIISDAAQKYGVDPNLIAAMAFRESRFEPNAVSSRGAQGLMQLMPRTARALGVSDSFDPQQNIIGGTKYVKYLLDRFHGDIDLSLAAYNAGPELVAKVGPSATQEAIEYVAAVKDYYRTALRAL